MLFNSDEGEEAGAQKVILHEEGREGQRGGGGPDPPIFLKRACFGALVGGGVWLGEDFFKEQRSQAAGKQTTAKRPTKVSNI